MARRMTLAATDRGPLTTPRYRGVTILVGVLVAVVLVVIFYPLAIILQRALLPKGYPDLQLWATALSSPDLAIAVRNTLIIAAANTAISVPVGVFFAWIVERTDARWGALSRLLPVIPLLLPPVAMTIGWLFLADPRAGFVAAPLHAGLQAIELGIDPGALAVQSWGGLILLYVLFSVPHVYVIAAAAFGALDPSLEEAARIFGKGRMRCFVSVSAPAIRHAVGSASLLCIISSFGLYSIPALIGTAARIDVLSVYIYRLLNASYPPKTGEAVVLGVLLILLIGALWLAQRRIAARAGHAQIGGMGVRPNRIALGRWRWPARIMLLLYVTLTSILPLLALFAVSLQPFWRPVIQFDQLSFDNFFEFWSEPQSRQAILNSAWLAILTTTCVVLIAGILAIVGRNLGGAKEKWLGVLTKTPSAIPHIVFAVGVLVAFGFAPFHLNGSWLILFLCYLAVFLPQASIAAEIRRPAGRRPARRGLAHFRRAAGPDLPDGATAAHPAGPRGGVGADLHPRRRRAELGGDPRRTAQSGDRVSDPDAIRQRHLFAACGAGQHYRGRLRGHRFGRPASGAAAIQRLRQRRLKSGIPPVAWRPNPVIMRPHENRGRKWDMPDLRYEAPATIADAVKALVATNGPAKILAGGTDVIVQMETDLIEPELLVDIKNIPELRHITAENGGFRIGAAVSGMEMMDHAALCNDLAGRYRRRQADRLHPGQGPRHGGGQPVQRVAGRRQRAAAGRSRRHRARSSGRTGTRDVPVETDPVGPGKTSLAKGEFIEILLPPGAAAHSGDCLPALHAAHGDGHRRRRRRR